MAWEQLSAKEICRELTDRARNGGRNLAQLADHFAHERLVLWRGRPASITPASPDRSRRCRMMSSWPWSGAGSQPARSALIGTNSRQRMPV